MKKVCYLCSTLEQTGPTSQLFNIISGLHQDQFKPLVVTLSPEKNNSLRKKFDAADIQVVCLDETATLRVKALMERLASLIESENAEVVHSQGIRADLIMSQLTKKLDVNWVATLRNVPYLDYPAQYGKVKGLLMAAAHLFALRRCKKIAVVSSAIRQPLQKFFTQPIHVIPNGIDVSYYDIGKVSPETIAELKKQYQLDGDSRNLIYTGVFEARKNLIPLLDQIDKVTGFKLLLVGKGSLLTKIQSHSAVVSGKAVVIGAVPDVRPFVLLSDAFVLVSKAEGLPNSVLEALSLDCPAILSDIGPHQEIHAAANKCTHIIELAELSSFSHFLTINYSEWRAGIKKGDCKRIAEEQFCSTVNSLNYQKLYE